VPVSVANAKLWNASIEFEQQPGGKVMIKSASPLIEAEIFDARGKTLAKTALSGTQALIGSSGQSQAMYLRVRTEAGVTTRVFKDL
jgi:hypothetical protein